MLRHGETMRVLQADAPRPWDVLWLVEHFSLNGRRAKDCSPTEESIISSLRSVDESTVLYVEAILKLWFPAETGRFWGIMRGARPVVGVDHERPVESSSTASMTGGQTPSISEGSVSGAEGHTFIERQLPSQTHCGLGCAEDTKAGSEAEPSTPSVRFEFETGETQVFTSDPAVNNTRLLHELRHGTPIPNNLHLSYVWIALRHAGNLSYENENALDAMLGDPVTKDALQQGEPQWWHALWLIHHVRPWGTDAQELHPRVDPGAWRLICDYGLSPGTELMRFRNGYISVCLRHVDERLKLFIAELLSESFPEEIHRFRSVIISPSFGDDDEATEDLLTMLTGASDTERAQQSKTELNTRMNASLHTVLEDSEPDSRRSSSASSSEVCTVGSDGES
jgi:hypothetical protein